VKTRRRAAVADPVPAPIVAAIAGLWPDTDVPLVMNVAPFASPDLRTAVLAIVVGAHEDATGPALSIGPADVQVFAGAFDRNGKALGSTKQTVSVNPQPASDRTMVYETFSRIDLEPGRYEIRAAIEDGRSGRTGSVYGYVDVPDFARAPVSLSGLTLHAGPALTTAPALRDILPAVPTARREFAHGESVTAFVRAYQGVSRAMIPGYLTAEIRDDQNQPVFHQESRILPQQFGAGRALDFSVDVPTDRLRAGEYVLTIQARHGNEIARRDARFRMR
jgi:hypothetical protein